MTVPSKMMEFGFWTKYCGAEYLDRTKDAAATTTEAVDDEDIAVFTKEDDIVLNSSRWKIQHLNPTLDMAADSSDDYLSITGHGVAHDGMKESMESMASAQKHSSLHVVWSQQTEAAETEADTEFQKSQMDWVPQMTEIDDDLKGPLPSSFVPLTIQRPL
ncbi:unnamed protein product [Sphagnum troendelagicum]|uniref:Uncharacterized protein n=1 Tax=Sphagnum troendelagicum TaxID=128251 RepID=A0ABP0UJF1_9BRYO